eukprot:13198077-Ditylum_brightwellii.AAC.2
MLQMQNFVLSHTTRLLAEHRERFNVDLTSLALFNGMTEIKLLDEQMFKRVYSNDKEFQWLIKLTKDPSKRCQRYLNKFHYSYRQPIRDDGDKESYIC